MEYLNETVFIDTNHHSRVPVGTVKEYVDLSEAETARMLYKRLNRNRAPGNYLSIQECTRYAQEARRGVLGDYILTKMRDPRNHDDLYKVIMEGTQEVFKAYSEDDENTPLVFHFVEVKVPVGDEVKPFVIPVTGEQANWKDEKLLKLFYEKKGNLLYSALRSLSKLSKTINFTAEDLSSLEAMRIRGGFTDANIFGTIQAPVGDIVVKLDDFSDHAIDMMEQRSIGPGEAQMFVDTAMFIMNQSSGKKHKYVFVSAIGSSVISMMAEIETKPNSIEKIVTNWEIPFRANTKAEKEIKKRLEAFMQAVVNWIEKNKGIKLTVRK
jgi:hypothetical protein